LPPNKKLAELRRKKHGVEMSRIFKKEGYIGRFFGRIKVKGQMLLPPQPGEYCQKPGRIFYNTDSLGASGFFGPAAPHF
jgi:hypothetical protein